MAEPWASVEDIGEHLGVSKDTIYAWIAKRDMPAHRVGRLWKFQHSEVDAWVRFGSAAETIDHNRVDAHKAQQDRTE
jgi:excisionase family DNA binding protein